MSGRPVLWAKLAQRFLVLALQLVKAREHLLSCRLMLLWLLLLVALAGVITWRHQSPCQSGDLSLNGGALAKSRVASLDARNVVG